MPFYSNLKFYFFELEIKSKPSDSRTNGLAIIRFNIFRKLIFCLIQLIKIKLLPAELYLEYFINIKKPIC